MKGGRWQGGVMEEGTWVGGGRGGGGGAKGEEKKGEGGVRVEG